MENDRPVLVVIDEVIQSAAKALYGAFKVDDMNAFIGADYGAGERITVDGSFHLDTLASAIFSALTSGRVATISHAPELE